uniref:hypothetical protein n=1 Tax=Hydrogenophaga sp. TaxID=1904254 RepID=UPI00356A8A7D
MNQDTPTQPAWPLISASLGLAFACLCIWPIAHAQNATPASTPPLACASPAEMTPAHLYGLWQVTLRPLDAPVDAPGIQGSLQFERHPEYPGSVRGRFTRGDGLQQRVSLVSGDVTGGEFNLDESADGKNMDAVWTGDISP